MFRLCVLVVRVFVNAVSLLVCRCCACCCCLALFVVVCCLSLFVVRSLLLVVCWLVSVVLFGR